MQKIIAIVGPTSSGKTSLSIELAKNLSGEIISADSRQVYRGLDLASGKVTQEEMSGVPHHLLDVVDPQHVFSASEYETLGKKVLQEIFNHGNIPVVAGGTGFYIDALLGRISLAEVEPNELLRSELEKLSLKELQKRLEKIDPGRFETIDIQNPRRLVRAIEIAEALGKNPTPVATSSYEVFWIGIDVPQDTLRERIHTRLMERLEEGMIEEIKNIELSNERLEQLGLECRYVGRYLNGSISYEEMVEQLELEIVHYAKRQMTWFKKNKNIVWFAPEELDKALEQAQLFIQK